MKYTASFYRILLLLSLIYVVAACSGGDGPGEETKSEPATVPTSSPKFDPLDLPQDTRIIPQLQPHKGEIIGSGNEAAANSDTVENKPVEPAKPIKPQVDSLASQALRIQLHSSEAFGDAKRERLIAEEIFDQPVYLDYEVPYYKVRVGSFSERKDAESYLQKAKTAGYLNAWIVAVRINVKEAQPLYDNLSTPQPEADKGK